MWTENVMLFYIYIYIIYIYKFIKFLCLYFLKILAQIWSIFMHGLYFHSDLIHFYAWFILLLMLYICIFFLRRINKAFIHSFIHSFIHPFITYISHTSVFLTQIISRRQKNADAKVALSISRRQKWNSRLQFSKNCIFPNIQLKGVLNILPPFKNLSHHTNKFLMG